MYFLITQPENCIDAQHSYKLTCYIQIEVAMDHYRFF